MANRFEVAAVFKAIDKITAPISRMQNNILKMTRKTRQGLMTVSRTAKSVGSGMRRAAIGMAASFAIIGFAMSGVINTGMEFEQQVVNATAKINGLKKGSLEFSNAMKIIEESAREAGSTTEFTATQAAMALNELTTAGFTAPQAAKALPGVINLATIAQIELAEAADISTGALGGFGLKVDDASQRALNLARINDVLAKTSTTSKAKIVDLAEALTKGASAVRVAGGDVETFGALTGVMAEGMIRGSVAGTTIAQMYKKLATPSAKAAKIWRKWNIEIEDSEGNLADIADIMQKLAPHIKKLGTKQALAALTELFGQRGFKGAAVILAQGEDSLRKFRNELKKSGGAARDMADIMRDFTLGNWKKFKSALQEVNLKLFDLVKGPFLAMVKIMAKFIIKHDDMINKLKPFVPLILGIGAALVVLFGVFLTLTAGVIAFGFVMSSISAIMAAPVVAGWTAVILASAAGIIILVLALIAAAVIVSQFHREWLTLMDGLDDSTKVWLNFALPIVALVNVFSELKEILDQVGDVFANKIAKGLLTVQTAMENIKDLARFIPSVFGFGDAPSGDDVSTAADIGRAERQFDDEGTNIVTQAERTKAAILFGLKDSAINRSELTIRDETGRAELTGGKLGSGLTLESSGAF